jgi:hypothetical protein
VKRSTGKPAARDGLTSTEGATMSKRPVTGTRAKPNRIYTVDHGKTKPQRRGGWYLQKYPFDRMAIGDSFFVPATDLPKSGPNVLNAAARQRGMRASVREEGDGYRCWRVL